MKLRTTDLPGVALLEPRIYADAPGFFYESSNKRTSHELQIGAEQATTGHRGEVFDVVVDLRRPSPSFGKHVALRLSAERPQMLWVPPGFALGFAALSPYAEMLYKMTDYYAPQHERTLLWNNPALNITWPLASALLLSAKDAAGIPLALARGYAG